jgi:recombination protein RecA
MPKRACSQLTIEQMFGIISAHLSQRLLSLLAGLEPALGKKHKRNRRRNPTGARTRGSSALQRQLDMAVATIQRRYGPGILAKGGSSWATGTPYISTGFPPLDRALGIGGLPKGRVCEITGPATSGKTTLALKFLAQAQAGGGQVAYIDQALYFDPDYAHRCQLDLSRLLIGRPCDPREALAMAGALALNGNITALVLDALDFLWTDPASGSLLAATLNRLPTSLVRSSIILLVLHESPAGSSSALSTLAHCATVRLSVTREHWLSYHSDIRGYEARVEVLKNQMAPAGRKVTIAIEFNGTVRGNGL